MKTSILASVVAAELALACAAGEGHGVAASDAPAAGEQPEEVAPPPARPRGGEPPVRAPEPPLFEAGLAPAPAAADRCDKVDFLYVVDNSPSMTDKQANLARSFLGFSQVVEDRLGTNDHHIMVIDTDDRNVGDVIAGMYPGAPTDDHCIGMLGAGLRMGAEGQSCGLEGHERYLMNGQPDLAGTFSCLAKVGTLGNVSERPVDALLAATGAVPSDVGRCNAGFLRDDAVLVVTLITDEEDTLSNGDPEGWRRSLLAVKDGNESAVVVLGLIADLHLPGGLPGGPCDTPSGDPSPRLHEFVASFELGSLGSVCAPDYSSFFARAVENIDTACSEFVPSLH